MYLQTSPSLAPAGAGYADRQQSGATVLQILMLAVLAAGAGLGPAGLLAGAVFALGLHALLAGAVRRAGVDVLGPADLVTLTRAGLVGLVTALVVDGAWSGGSTTALLVGVASVALALDAVDGQVARRTGTVSALGARFDMETDAFLILVLSVHVALVLGPWVLVIGALRYAFVAASWVLPRLTGALPPRISAKAIAAAQGIVLVVASAGLLPLAAAAALVGAALVALLWSFGRDTVRLLRTAPVG